MEVLVNEVIRAHDEDDLYWRCLKEIYTQYQPSHCVVAEFDVAQNQAITLVYLIDGKRAKNIRYSLAGTPCDNVRNDRNICRYNSDVQQQFPDDFALQELGIESYYGVPLLNQEGCIVGVLALLYSTPLTQRTFDDVWLRTAGLLIGKTIVQQRLTREKNQLLAQFERSEHITQSCSWNWDVTSNQFTYSNNLKSMFAVAASCQLSFDTFFSNFIFRSPRRYAQFLSGAITPSSISKVVIDKEHTKCGLVLELTFYKSYSEKGELKSIEGNIKNITDFSQLENNHLIATKVIELSSNGVIVTDEDNRIRHMNAKAEQITGFSQGEVYGKSPSIFRSGMHDKKFYSAMWHQIGRTGHWSGEVWNKAKTGAIYPESLSISAVKDNNGIVKNYIGIFDDISDRKLMESELLKYKNKQDFTGLQTRTKFMQYFDQHKDLIVVLLDIHRFSAINNLYGESFGNKVLRYVGLQLYRNFRGGAVSVCRYAADQFALAWHIDNLDDIETLIDEIRTRVEKPFYIDGRLMKLHINMGYAMPEDMANSTHLMAKAYYALDTAKSQPHPSTVRYSIFLEKNIGRKETLGIKLKQAIDEARLHVEYQPIYDLVQNKVVKFEALARWTESDEVISPFEFIPIAEEFGYISQLGDLILSQVCRDLTHLKRLGYQDVKISVNRSIDELTDESIESCSILEILHSFGLSTSDIIIEITESVPLEDKPEVQELLHSLRHKGLQLALDDFGTGFASFSNLMKNSVDILKIDRSFIRNIESDKTNAVLVQSVNMLATQLGLDVIAEGVETQEQLNLLSEMGCRYIQGYFISKPVLLEQAKGFLTDEYTMSGLASIV
ncbi:diguanylate cyclase [Vibrio panuliri]|uniref:Diguanylate cyclase n=1 Tax=Vibrio panuliri TaxID=1381081 RepID=A0A1Q9HA37_9VIBR|nr:EAL domain-containing protein [Vibrio panuliri]OLQ85917.1 diguanylate cyclase [Vibrio panuliri]